MDIGAGTQDLLLYDDRNREMENNIKLVLPSPTQMVARQIQEESARGNPICLTGRLMGGGASSRAVRQHLKQGLKVYSLPEPARTIKDNLDYVRQLGVKIVEKVPEGVSTIQLGDIRSEALEETLQLWGIDSPDHFALAVQDHGYSPQASNRRFRFQHWQSFLEEDGSLRGLVYRRPPEYMTRMKALQEVFPEALVMDTGAAAIWGALCDPRVRERMDQGLVVVNIGNKHTLGMLVYREKVWGIFEHHTGQLKARKIADLIQGLREGTLVNEEVFNDGGHGASLLEDLPTAASFDFVAVTGPRRGLVEEMEGLYFAVPYGDMMLSGCFGLVRAMLDT